MLFLFWLVVIYLSSSLYEIDVRVELLADDLWEANDDKPGFLIVGLDSFDQLFLHKLPMSLPMVENSNKNQKYDKWEYMKGMNKSKNVKRSILMNVQNVFLMRPHYEKIKDWKNWKIDFDGYLIFL